MAKRGSIVAGLAAEVAFAVLPLVVLVIVLIHGGRGKHILSSPEWSFGAAILFGQTLAKFTSGLARGGRAPVGPVALTVALLVVFAIAPSLLVLTLTLQTAEECGKDPSGWLQGMQVFFFLSSSVLYMLLGTVGELA